MDELHDEDSEPRVRNPDELIEDFRAGAMGAAEIDMEEVLWEILGDTLDSVKLALVGAGCDSDFADAITSEVQDYLVNHYGED